MTTLERISLAATLAAATLGVGQPQAAPNPGNPGPNAPGPKYEIMHTFNGDGIAPVTPKLAIDAQGTVYGTTISGGGDLETGSLWSLSPPNLQHKTTIFSLLDYSNRHPGQGVARATNGTIYYPDSNGIDAFAPGARAATVVTPIRPVSIAATPQGPLYFVTSAGGSSGKGVLCSVAPPAPPVLLYAFGETVAPGIAPSTPSWIGAGADGTTGVAGTPGNPEIPGTPAAGRTIFKRAPGQAGITVPTTVSPAYGYPLGAVPDGKGNLHGVTNDGNLDHGTAGGWL